MFWDFKIIRIFPFYLWLHKHPSSSEEEANHKVSLKIDQQVQQVIGWASQDIMALVKH